MIDSHDDIYYTYFIAHIANFREVRKYLEIGVNSGSNLKEVSCDIAVGVDPNFVIDTNVCSGKKETHLIQATSDAFFRSGKAQELAPGGFDLAFLDGMHLFEYLLRDFYHTERCCHRNALIVLHDCIPLNVEMTSRTFIPSSPESDAKYRNYWTGDVWKAVHILQKIRPDLKITALKCPPTGLIVISELDPSSTVLQDNYDEIVSKYKEIEGTDAAISEFTSSLRFIDTREIDLARDHSLFFRI